MPKLNFFQSRLFSKIFLSPHGRGTLARRRSARIAEVEKNFFFENFSKSPRPRDVGTTSVGSNCRSRKKFFFEKFSKSHEHRGEHTPLIYNFYTDKCLPKKKFFFQSRLFSKKFLSPHGRVTAARRRLARIAEVEKHVFSKKISKSHSSRSVYIYIRRFKRYIYIRSKRYIYIRFKRYIYIRLKRYIYIRCERYIYIRFERNFIYGYILLIVYRCIF